MNQQRIILIFVVVTSVLIGIAIQEASALKDSKKWFDARNFYKEINKMDMFDKYPYEAPELTIKIVNTGSKITEKYYLEYMNHNQIIKPKEFKNDKYTTEFPIDNSKRKVCLSSIDSSFKKCKNFESFDDKSTITFYIR